MADEVATFFNGYSDDVCALAKALREQVMDAAPNATETLHTGWKVVSYGHKKKFCAIEGTGKAVRHHKVHTAAKLGPELSNLIRKAANRA